jgi:hypothetical protein
LIDLTPPSVTTKAREDFAKELYATCRDQKLLYSTKFASPNATWFALLRGAVQNTDEEAVSGREWIDGIATAMSMVGIEWTLGSHRGKLTSRQVINLAGHVRGRQILAARPGSLKRAAMEAQWKMDQQDQGAKRPRRRVIDFGQPLPFTSVPPLVLEGFQKLDRTFENGNIRIQAHYLAAHSCLVLSLGEPLCDLMLMLTLTMAASSATPTVASYGRTFEAASKKKDPAMLAANMVTRMLWFLKPGAFPWDDSSRALSVNEMTKKMGKHLGLHTRV